MSNKSCQTVLCHEEINIYFEITLTKKPSMDNVIRTLMLGNYKQEYFLNVLSYQQITSPAVQPCTLVFCLLLSGKSRNKIHPAALGNMSKFIRFSKKYFVIDDLNLRTSARYFHWNEL